MRQIRQEKWIKQSAAGLLMILLLISVLFLWSAWRAGYFRSSEALRSYLESYGKAGPLVLTLIQALQVVLPVLPGFFGCFAGAALFGAAEGFWINYIGISAGSLVAFWLARRYGIGLVQKMVPMERYEKWTSWMNGKKLYSIILFLAILLPLAPDDFLCYFSGLIGMSAKKFTWIVILAKPWCILLYSILFSHLV